AYKAKKRASPKTDHSEACNPGSELHGALAIDFNSRCQSFGPRGKKRGSLARHRRVGNFGRRNHCALNLRISIEKLHCQKPAITFEIGAGEMQSLALHE